MDNSIKIPFVAVTSLIFANKLFPEKTPRRWHLISEYVQKASCIENEQTVKCPEIVIGVGETCVPFCCSHFQCKAAYTLLKSFHIDILQFGDKADTVPFSDPSRSAFKPLILLPPIAVCCAKSLNIRNRPSFPIVYGTMGTLVAAMFTGHCSTCGTTHHSYCENSSAQHKFYASNVQTVHFQVSSKTVFEVQLLTQLTAQLLYSACTFESQADVYNILNEHLDRQRLESFVSGFGRSNKGVMGDASEWKLNVTRLEDGWFLYQLVQHFCLDGTISTVNFNIFTAGNRRDIEHLCKAAMYKVTTQPAKWVHHECDVKGCREGMVTIDGNEKLNRAMCAAPKSKVKCDVNHINLVSCCIKSPITGGKHILSSKFCEDHQELDSPSLGIFIPLSSLHAASSSSHFSTEQLGTLPDSESVDLLTGCRKSKNVNRYFDRTAGIVAAVRPCGIVVNFSEMYTCESPTQMYTFLVFTFGHASDMSRLKYIAYDRACDLHPFLCNLKKKGAYFTDYILKNVGFFVDRFHVKGHTEPCCLPPGDDNPSCAYHPDLPEFVAVKSANTECAEQCFRWLNKYKTIVRNMKQHRCNPNPRNSV